MEERKYKLGFKNLYLTLHQIEDLIKSGRYMPIRKEVLREVEGRHILDLGCNIGIFSSALAKEYPNSSIIGIDSSAHPIEIAKIVHANLPNLAFKIMDVSDLQFNDNDFDCVCFLDVIEHVDCPAKVLKEIYKVLRPSGKLIVSTNNVYYLRFLLRQIVYDILRKKPKLMIHDESEKWNRHIFCWDISTLCTLLEENGFAYEKHFYAGSSGVYLGDGGVSRFVDKFFTKIFPFFRATAVVKFIKI